ncbi:MAG: type 4a pilus biogenesis protein PilO [Planctomycetes bacterium]|nr:type 4a pilus biogenesis protein PilO [Planctomycetota bacterium]
MFFMKTYRKYFMIVGLTWAGCLILFVCAYMVAIGPQQKRKEQVENQLVETKRLYDSAMNADQEETKVRANEEIETLRNKLKDFVVDFEESANLTFDISQIASEKKVDSFSIKNQEKTRLSAGNDLKYLQENHINLSFVGDFNQFATFLNALERHKPVFFVDNFRIIRSQQNDSKHKVNMNLAVFVLKQQDS